MQQSADVSIQGELRRGMLSSSNMSDERAIIGGGKSQGLKDVDAI
jgi:hypothetical protein